MMTKYSIIIPVYNRPDELNELLDSLTDQKLKDFEVIVIEDGSSLKCKDIVDRYVSFLNITYYFKENSGQGFTRNYGFERANGDWLIVFDSDCIIPPDYLIKVEDFLSKNEIDAFGGPDKAHSNFSPIQKAISYSMTSLFTTGGIRGNKKGIGVFHPRSFNMGISKRVFQETGGYILPRKGEDIEFSLRIIEKGFKTSLIENAFVFHKRRTNFKQFFKQLHFFGTARINIFRFFKKELKLVHFFPTVFLIGMLTIIPFYLLSPRISLFVLSLYVLFFLIIFLDSGLKTKSIKIAFLSVFAAFVQLTAYGTGFLKEATIFLIKG